MQKEELISSIVWHLECMDFSTKNIDNFTPPADGFQMRINYSLYLSSIISVVDLIIENCEQDFENLVASKISFKNFSGNHICSYIRELRNSVIHRGFDPTASGIVIDGHTMAMSPTPVTDRKGKKSYDAPFPLLRALFAHYERAVKLEASIVLAPFLKDLADKAPEEKLSDILQRILSSPYIPDWAKKMTAEHLKPEMLADADPHQIKKLKQLLNA